MGAIRREGKINSHVSIIDSGMNHLTGMSAVYLIQSGKSCLIDGGTREGAPALVRKMKDAGAFPPDYIILTHSHWDHCQGVNYLRREAEKMNKQIIVYAGEKAIPNLGDQSFNKVFDRRAKFENIHDVIPLQNGYVLDLDPLELVILDAPGHHDDHIVVYAREDGILFAGDAMGIELIDDVVIPTFMPPCWDKKQYFETIRKLKKLDVKGLCLAHYGFIDGKAADKYTNQLILSSDKWWQVLSNAESMGNIDNLDTLALEIYANTDLTGESLREADIEINKKSIKVILACINGVRAILRKKKLSPVDLFLPTFLDWTVKGYKSDRSL